MQFSHTSPSHPGLAEAINAAIRDYWNAQPGFENNTVDVEQTVFAQAVIMAAYLAMLEPDDALTQLERVGRIMTRRLRRRPAVMELVHREQYSGPAALN